jgi:hypothetical protein
VQVSPDGQSIALRVTFGFVLSEDRGRSFRWVCEDVFNYATGAFDPAFTFDQSRRLYIGAPDGLARSSADRCEASRVAALERQFVIDLDRSPDGRSVLAITSSGDTGAVNRVWRSDDGGERFAPLGEGFGPETLFETVELAPTDSTRVYATGVRNDPRATVFFRSDDRGATLRETALDRFGVQDAFIAAIDPRDANVVYVRAPLSGDPPEDAGPNASPTVLLVTEDGGRTFRELTRTVGSMVGFARSDDGTTLWIGTNHPADGLQRSTDRGARWERVADTRVAGLRFDRGTLWVAANWVLDGYALGRSEDGGRTITPVLRSFCDLGGPPSCPASTEVSTVCGARWPIFRSNNLGCMTPPPAVDPPPLDGGAYFDAADRSIPVGPPPRDDSPAPTPGCRCATPGASGPGSVRGALALPALAAAVLALSARRRAAAPA